MALIPTPRKAALAALSCLLLASPAFADVRLPAIISDHMVLQRAARVPLWGWAAPGERVTATVGSQSRATRAGQDGRWRVDVDLSHAAAGPIAVAVRGEHNALTLDDVLVGEVWLASGQSNMEKPLGEQHGQKPTFNAEAEIAAADHPDIRLFKVAKARARQPADDVPGQWVRCSPQSVAQTKFSAAAYFFGRRLNHELHAPVGLVDSTWGGTRIELWTPAGSLVKEQNPDPRASTLYNGMIAGLAPFAIKGVIWYQGESNIIDSDDGAAYEPKMEALVASWRQLWHDRFPFYYVQVAPHLYHVVRHAQIVDPESEPRLWEAQALALRIPGTGMVVTTDLVDDLKDIHPRDKKTVGERLANLALAGTYGRKDIEADGPMFRSMQVEGGKAVLAFDHAEGLASRDHKALTWFDIAGEDGRYYPATAVIDHDRVVASSPKVAKPVAVRFAWDEAAEPNLVNQAGLPALPFRSSQPVAPAAQ